MRKGLVPAAALALALALPVGVLAQQSTTGTSGTSESSPQGSFSNATHASDIIGKKVYNPEGETVGSVNDLLINAQGQVQAAIVNTGGTMGMGSRTVAIDWSQVKINPSDNRVTVAMTKEQLKAAPEYKKSAQANAPKGEQTGQVPGSKSNQGQ